VSDEYLWILRGHTVVPATIDEWMAWMDATHADERRVDLTEIGEDCAVSTVFLGCLIRFETLVMGGPLDETTVRADTWEQAVCAHQMAVAAVRAEQQGGAA
jgi:hypothetical protein